MSSQDIKAYTYSPVSLVTQRPVRCYPHCFLGESFRLYQMRRIYEEYVVVSKRNAHVLRRIGMFGCRSSSWLW